MAEINRLLAENSRQISTVCRRLGRGRRIGFPSWRKESDWIRSGDIYFADLTSVIGS